MDQVSPIIAQLSSYIFRIILLTLDQLSPKGRVFLVCFLGGPLNFSIKFPDLLRSFYYSFRSSFSLFPRSSLSLYLLKYFYLDQVSPCIPPSLRPSYILLREVL